jgi:hypothetical protein
MRMSAGRMSSTAGAGSICDDGTASGKELIFGRGAIFFIDGSGGRGRAGLLTASDGVSGAGRTAACIGRFAGCGLAGAASMTNRISTHSTSRAELMLIGIFNSST